MNLIRTGCLGLSPTAYRLLDAISRHSSYRITAVADGNISRAKAAAEKYNCPALDDFRQLIVQHEMDALVVSAEMHQSEEFIRMAMENGTHIFKLPPAGARYQQVCEFAKLAKKNNVVYRTACLTRYYPAFIAFREYLAGIEREKLYFLNAFCDTMNLMVKANDPQTAGGGVLLFGGFETIDAIVLCFGIPQQIYAVITNHAGDTTAKLYKPEDTAAVTMKFGPAFAASLLVCNAVRPLRTDAIFDVRGSDFNISVHPGRLLITDSAGKTIQDRRFAKAIETAQRKMLDDFAANFTDAGGKVSEISNENDIDTMAAIEIAYLSSKTGMPEGPQKIRDI